MQRNKLKKQYNKEPFCQFRCHALDEVFTRYICDLQSGLYICMLKVRMTNITYPVQI
jgi:hypothetical protein